MPVEFYVVLAVIMLGIGAGTVLSRRNLVSAIFGLVTCGLGAVVAMAAFNAGRPNEGTDGMLFALCIAVVLMVFVVLGCALMYRRHLSEGTTDVTEGNRLRH